MVRVTIGVKLFIGLISNMVNGAIALRTSGGQDMERRVPGPVQIRGRTTTGVTRLMGLGGTTALLGCKC